MRTWYHLELTSGYGLSEAERLCRVMINDSNLSARYKSEFFSKLGNCFMFAARSAIYTDREKTIENLSNSIKSYLDAVRIGVENSTLSLSETLDWLEIPLWKLFNYCQGDLNTVFKFIENFVDEKKDIAPPAANLIINVILSVRAPNSKDGRLRIRNFCNRMVGKINKSARPLSKFPGLKLVIEALEGIRIELEKLDAIPSSPS